MRAHLNTGLFVILIALGLLLSGCNGGGGSSGTDYSTGTQGLTLEFLPASPQRCPSVLYHNDPADVEMHIENKGASSASGSVHLSGFDTNIFEGLSRDYSFSSIAGRSQNLPTGGEIDLSDSFTVRLPNGVDDLPDVNLQADLCYSYKTQPYVQVCVDPDPTDNENDACAAGVTGGVSGGQGAPIALSSVNVESSKSRTTFTFTVSDSGKGEPYLGGNCRDIPAENQESIRLTKAQKSDGSSLNCTPSVGSKLRLDGGRIQFTCKMDNIGDSAYVTVLSLGFDYNYKQTSSVKVCGKRG